MNISTLKRALVLAGLLIMAAVFAGCGAASPAPPVEVPAPVVLKFVEAEDLAIDFSAVALPVQTSISAAKAVGPGGFYTEVIDFGPNLVSDIAETTELDLLLDALGQLQIPIDSSVTTFTGYQPCIVSEQAWNLAPLCLVKVDLADYDFDGDGVTEGCSGHSAQLPVCLRIWWEGERLAAWVFDTYAEEGNAGTGRFRIFTDFPTELPNLIHRLWVKMIYNHTDPENRSSEVYFKFGEIIDGVEVASALAHAETTQTGPDATAIKYLNASLRQVAATPEDTRYIARFKEDEDYWSGTWTNGISGIDFGAAPDSTNVCARISTGNVVEPAFSGMCDLLGISVGSTGYVSIPEVADVEPQDFPASPTF